MDRKINRGVCGDCRQMKDLYRNPFGPIAVCFDCRWLHYMGAGNVRGQLITMYLNTKQVEYSMGFTS